MRFVHDKIIWFISASFLVFLFSFALGVVAAKLNPWPLTLIRQAVLSVAYSAQSWYETGEFYRHHSWFEVPEGTSRSTVKVHRPDAVASGYRTVLAYVPTAGGFEAWLFDQDGEKLHSWPIDYQLLDSDGPLNGDDEPHGMVVLNDGSIVLTFDSGDVLARIDGCGQPIWVRSGVYHHMIDIAEDGSLFVWKGENTAYGDYQSVEQIDPKTGQTLRTISLKDILALSDQTHVIKFSMPLDYEFREFDKNPPEGQDHFHPNDVEALTASMAGSFPDFSAGDLLLSFRNRNLVTVIDGRSGRIKWSQNGPWHQQHDPDFQPDGTITVYDNNNYPGFSGDRRSSIIAIDPKTRVASKKFGTASLPFHSTWGGVHQALPNGTWQIVVPTEGRIVEVDKNSNIVWEFNNVLTKELNAYILNGSWHPEDYFKTFPACVSEKDK